MQRGGDSGSGRLGQRAGSWGALGGGSSSGDAPPARRSSRSRTPSNRAMTAVAIEGDDEAAEPMDSGGPAGTSNGGGRAAAAGASGGSGGSDADLPSGTRRNSGGSGKNLSRRIIANRESAQRSRMRKLQYISDLEANIASLNEQVSQLEPQLGFLKAQHTGYGQQNDELRSQVAQLLQDTQQKDSLNEALRGELSRLRQTAGAAINQQRLTQPPPPASSAGGGGGGGGFSARPLQPFLPQLSGLPQLAAGPGPSAAAAGGLGSSLSGGRFGLPTRPQAAGPSQSQMGAGFQGWNPAMQLSGLPPGGSRQQGARHTVQPLQPAPGPPLLRGLGSFGGLPPRRQGSGGGGGATQSPQPPEDTSVETPDESAPVKHEAEVATGEEPGIAAAKQSKQSGK